MANNVGKIRLRRGTTANWGTGSPTLYEGQPAIEYADGAVRMKVGPETTPTAGGTTAWSSCQYVSPQYYSANSDGAKVSTSAVGSGTTPPGVLRNVVISTSEPSANSYSEGTVLLIIEQ